MAVIAGIEFHKVKQQLNQPFITILQKVEKREVTVVVVRDAEGREGYGECVAFDTPWYTEETVTGSRFVMEQVLAPLLIDEQLEQPAEAARLFSKVKGNHMAKAAVEMAVWDLFAKRNAVPLYEFVGGVSASIPAGVVVAGKSDELFRNVKMAIGSGYRRIKLKISPDSNAALLKKLVASNPEISFYADANGSFSGRALEELLTFDEAGFALIEQPYGEQEWEAHRMARSNMTTPICLDESIHSLEDVKRMAEQQAGDIVVLKMGRLGGWTETLKVVEFCRNEQIGMWVGGMIEFGISKAHNLALASLPEVKLTGDFSDSTYFWQTDIISPEIRVENGEIKLSDSPGIGYELKI
ncbi:o-succinylbenzoate synthase [Planococcus sp. CP5-4]|uniref:o-succinylbenzoate synthase n=1 Tax=unclassified Planococcus (in: firmicutes) TaxID=2662419 RepID=UPI001C24C53E|nr:MULTISPECIES: o-succinylbenzoate synthase [unclassified Planococcus (in: firmicutes)]MBU9673065.1 o-succinylbenzoate synthase [Planococcus sp. CP5-4_YE]MBV0908837.1 o-succinylbenzoate synthase [Planococcus sp. CP5-4_UN]MBW6063606.1 o-succinylbenzoate synthase [Planococcus sp. CP5-4]